MASNGTNLGLRTWRAFAQYLLLIGLFGLSVSAQAQPTRIYAYTSPPAHLVSSQRL
jgi:hypothetical protein